MICQRFPNPAPCLALSQRVSSCLSGYRNNQQYEKNHQLIQFGTVNGLVKFAWPPYMFLNLDQNGLDYDNHSQSQCVLGFVLGFIGGFFQIANGVQKAGILEMLRLNRMTDYGIVVLGALAHRHGEVIATASLAELTGINQPTVAKVAKLLLGAGLVDTQRGANGGYRLAFPAEDISLVRIIESIEGPIAVNDCVDGAQDPCAVANCCFMSGTWNKVNARVRAALEQMSLADLIDPAHLFPIAGDDDEMTAPLHTPLPLVDREDEPHGRNHPDN